MGSGDSPKTIKQNVDVFTKAAYSDLGSQIIKGEGSCLRTDNLASNGLSHVTSIGLYASKQEDRHSSNHIELPPIHIAMMSSENKKSITD